MINSALEDIGLTHAESIVYIKTLELGSTTSGPIIERSTLQSSVVHRVLKQLIAKGLLSYVTIGKDKHYQATSPQRLLSIIREKESTLNKIIPELILKQNLAGDRNAAEMFLGKNALFAMLNDMIEEGKRGEEFYSFALFDPDEDEDVTLFYKQYNRRRRDLGLRVYVLANSSLRKRYEKQYSASLLRKANIRYTDFQFPQGIIIFRNSVILVNWQGSPMAVKVTSTSIAEKFKVFFMDIYNRENKIKN